MQSVKLITWIRREETETTQKITTETLRDFTLNQKEPVQLQFQVHHLETTTTITNRKKRVTNHVSNQTVLNTPSDSMS